MSSVAVPESTARTLLRVLLPALLVTALLSAGAWWWWSRPVETPTAQSDHEPGPSTEPAPAAAPAPAISEIERAAEALAQRRLLSPAGDNAVEWYLRALDRQPDLASARQALLELIPQAAIVLEQSIDRGELEDAEREYALFERMGVSELRLASLRERLAQARAARATADLASQPPAAPALAARAAPPASVQPSAPAPATKPPTATATPPSPLPDPVPAAAPPAPATAPASTSAPQRAIREARQIVDVKPAYPNAARQRRVEGWVELELGVDASGRVVEVEVVASEPPRVFDREAVRAAQRWRFDPRLEDGVAVASRVRKKLSFRL